MIQAAEGFKLVTAVRGVRTETRQRQPSRWAQVHVLRQRFSDLARPIGRRHQSLDVAVAQRGKGGPHRSTSSSASDSDCCCSDSGGAEPPLSLLAALGPAGAATCIRRGPEQMMS